MAFSLAVSSLADCGEQESATPLSLRVAGGPEQCLWTPIREHRDGQARVGKRGMKKQEEKRKGSERSQVMSTREGMEGK